MNLTAQPPTRTPAVGLALELAIHMQTRWVGDDRVSDPIFQTAVLVQALQESGIEAIQYRLGWSEPGGQGFEVVHFIILDGVMFGSAAQLGEAAIVASQAIEVDLETWRRSTPERMEDVINNYTRDELKVFLEDEVYAAVAFLDANTLSTQTPQSKQQGPILRL